MIFAVLFSQVATDTLHLELGKFHNEVGTLLNEVRQKQKSVQTNQDALTQALNAGILIPDHIEMRLIPLEQAESIQDMQSGINVMLGFCTLFLGALISTVTQATTSPSYNVIVFMETTVAAIFGVITIYLYIRMHQRRKEVQKGVQRIPLVVRVEAPENVQVTQ